MVFGLQLSKYQISQLRIYKLYHMTISITGNSCINIRKQISLIICIVMIVYTVSDIGHVQKKQYDESIILAASTPTYRNNVCLFGSAESVDSAIFQALQFPNLRSYFVIWGH